MIINLISEYTPIVGGGGVLAEELAKRLLAKGHRVNVITWGKPKNTCEVSRLKVVDSSEVEGSNPTIYRVGRLSQISPLQKLKFGYLAGKKVKDLKGIIHGHTFFFPLEKKRTVYTFHTTQLGELRALRKIRNKSFAIYISMIIKRLYLPWEKYIINNSAKLIAISQTIKNELLELGAKPKQIEVMPNTINVHTWKVKYADTFQVKGRKDAAHLQGEGKHLAKAHLEGEPLLSPPFIFTIGRLLPRKGFQDLIKAMSLLKNKKIKLLIAGVGEYQKTLKQLVKKLKLTGRVTFLGKIPPDKVKNYYSLADLTVIPSIYEPFGIVILEAMACGSPLVCTNVGDFHLIAGQAAVYTEPQNPKDLAEKIQSVLDNPKKAKKMAQYGLKKVKNYTWEPYIQKLEKLYRNLSTINN